MIYYKIKELKILTDSTSRPIFVFKTKVSCWNSKIISKSADQISKNLQPISLLMRQEKNLSRISMTFQPQVFNQPKMLLFGPAQI